MQPTPQHNQLMSKHRVLRFEPQLRLERRPQDGQHETEQPDHSASLGDSITSSTRIRFSVHTGVITNVLGAFEVIQSAVCTHPPEVVELTGISNEMVAGHKIDAAALVDFASAANIIIAHNAGFDRKFAERSWDFFRHRHWAWPSTGIDWRRHGLAGAKLAYLLNECGFFHGAHRALDDCHATLEILARPLPGTNKTALAALLDQARAKSFRVWAEGAPFNLKELLRRRRYRWNDGSDGRPKSWHIDVEETALANELDFLRKEIYGYDVDVLCAEITSLDRYSTRV